MKYLSVIIPFYNSADTLEKAAMSCLDSRILDDIEVIMVNDGSKDNSLEVARSIEKKFPSSVRVFDKPNGGKGSCMNVGIANATGKYLRELDSDDYFAEGSIVEFVAKIKHLQADVDVIHSNYLFVNLQTGKTETVSLDCLQYETIIDIKSTPLPDLSYSKYAMHSLTYRTEFLYSIDFVQSEGISYTDTEYIYYPMTQAKSIFFINLILYCYCLGVSGQSMSIEVMKKKQSHYWHLFDKFLTDEKYVARNANVINIREKVLLAVLLPAIRIYLSGKMYDQATERQIRKSLKRLRFKEPKIYFKLLKADRKGLFFPVVLWYLLGRFYFTFK